MDKNASNGLTRREFTTLAAWTAAAATLGVIPTRTANAQGDPMFSFPPLPYPEDALEPVISARTLSFHYGKHAKAYYDNTNKLMEGKPAGKTLEQVFLEASKDQASQGLFNNAAQAWNHTFYFSCMKKGGGGEPSGKLGDALKAAFGGFEGFKKAFMEAATTQFGSGWAWLAADGTSLKVIKTPNAMNPQVQGMKPLFTVDVWEHAYYLDYQNRRADYVKEVLEKLANWDFVAHNMA